MKAWPRMIKFVGSVALIRHPELLEEKWLARWNEREQSFGFVIAERLEGESYRACVDRQVSSTLRLRRGRDYIVSSVPRLHLDLPPGSVDEADETFYVLEFYVVDLYGAAALVTVDNDATNRWLTARELLSGTAIDGGKIESRLVTLLRRFEVFSAELWRTT